jgi:D-alanyl-D-alanine carboxypeptidase
MKTKPVSERSLKALHRELGIPVDYGTHRQLSMTPEANLDELVSIGQFGPREILLDAAAAAAWRALQTTAKRANLILLPLSGFRSWTRQAEIIRAKLAAGHAIESILTTNAAPGYSEHHTGRALDIGTLGDPPFAESFATTPAFKWLEGHASSHGFRMSFPPQNPHGICYEPWHWCWFPDVHPAKS